MKYILVKWSKGHTLVRSELETAGETPLSIHEQIINELWHKVEKLNMSVVSGSASANKCNDCGIENETVQTRPDGYGMQCYKCYKSDMDFEANYD